MITDFSKWQYPRVVIDGQIGRITFTKPEALNALSPEGLEELSEVLEVVAQQPIKVIVLTGAGDKAFIAGADIKSMATMTPEQAKAFSVQGQTVFNQLEDMPQITISYINGFALGGGLELALASDFIFVHDRARLGLPEVGLGLIPGFGGTVRLQQRIGKTQAKLLTLTGVPVSAKRAMELGLADGVMSPDADGWNQLIEKLAKPSPEAMRLAKKSIAYANCANRQQVMNNEAETFANCFRHADAKEGVTAFLEKRPPKWG